MALDLAPFGRCAIKPRSAGQLYVSPLVTSLSRHLLLSCALLSSLAHAEDPRPSIYIEKVACTSGPFGLRLPRTLPEVLKLGDVLSEQIESVEQWDGYTATRKSLTFNGLILGESPRV